MSDLLIFFVLPVATIILAVVLQKILRCPVLVAATAFAIYLILTYTVFDSSFLIFTIAYTILAFLAAYIAQLICRCKNSNCNICNSFNCNCRRDGNINLPNDERNLFNTNNLLDENNDYNFYDGINSNNSTNNSNYEALNYNNGYDNLNNNSNCSNTLYRCRKRIHKTF